MNLWTEKYKPMLLAEQENSFDSKDYIFELKYDGMRCLIYVSPSSLRIINRNLNDVTHLFPELNSIKKVVKKRVVFDGEIICTENGYPSFSKLQERLHLKKQSKIKNEVLNNGATFICFDIIYENKNITNLSLINRKKRLNQYKNNDYFIKTNYTDNYGKKLFKEIKKLKLEGIVAKEKSSKYYINYRTKEWIKIKNYQKEIFIIGAFSYKENSHVFSVYLGESINYDLRFVGKVFISKKNKLFDILKHETKTNNYFSNLNLNNIFYIKPKFKCWVKYIERTKSNNLRQPFYFKGGKNDKIKEIY